MDKSPIEKAKEICPNVNSSFGINWSWVIFQKEEQALAFVAWLLVQGYDFRGPYAPHNGVGYGVRYR